MNIFKTVEIKEDILSRNNEQAKQIRADLKAKKIFFLNVMSSPGSGKPEKTGVKTVQIHTSGACHLTCQMAWESLLALGLEGLDFVILENIGNLVCPAEFDTGANFNLVLLSVPEGDDKPLKYPLMFEVASAVAVTKADVAAVFDFSAEQAKRNISLRNPQAPVFITSAANNEGIDKLEALLRARIEEVKR